MFDLLLESRLSSPVELCEPRAPMLELESEAALFMAVPGMAEPSQAASPESRDKIN